MWVEFENGTKMMFVRSGYIRGWTDVEICDCRNWQGDGGSLKAAESFRVVDEK